MLSSRVRRNCAALLPVWGVNPCVACNSPSLRYETSGFQRIFQIGMEHHWPGYLQTSAQAAAACQRPAGGAGVAREAACVEHNFIGQATNFFQHTGKRPAVVGKQQLATVQAVAAVAQGGVAGRDAHSVQQAQTWPSSLCVPQCLRQSGRMRRDGVCLRAKPELTPATQVRAGAVTGVRGDYAAGGT